MKRCSLVAPVLLAIVVATALFPASASAQPPVYITQWVVYPVGIAVDGGGNVYVVGTDRVQVFTSNGVYMTQWGTFGSGDGAAGATWGRSSLKELRQRQSSGASANSRRSTPRQGRR